MAQESFQTIHNNINFCLSASVGFTAWGYTFEPNPKYTVERPVEFWKAQLAFRGPSPRGRDVNALRRRLKHTKMNTMDAGVERAFQLLLAEQRTAEASITSRKRKADGEEAGDRLDKAERALARRKEQAESDKQRIYNRYMRLSGREDGGEGSSRSAPAKRPKNTAIETQALPRKERVIDKQMAKKNPEKFLRDAFLNEYGKDAGWGPVELERLDSWERCQVHQAAESLRLYHETTVTSVMVIGSGKNMQGQHRLKELNRAAGWRPPVRYVPDFDNDEEEEKSEFSEEDSEGVDENINSEGDNDSSEEPDEEEDEEEWDITGSWEIECPDMAGCFGQYAPYTLEIFVSQHRLGRQIYGRFDFGAYKGVFRFSIEQQKAMGNRYKENDIEEFFLPNDIPSEENPTMSYRWRGREDGENVIQLRSENALYQMTFSDGGRRVTGTWDCDGDPGFVEFSGVKVGDHGIHDGMNINHEWVNLNENTYNRENRDRWKRRY
jgi:hypothetical protein